MKIGVDIGPTVCNFSILSSRWCNTRAVLWQSSTDLTYVSKFLVASRGCTVVPATARLSCTTFNPTLTDHKGPKITPRNGLSAVPFESFFQLDANTHTRGHSVKLKKKSFHTELRQHFFSEQVFVEQSGRRDSYSIVTKQFQEQSDQIIRQRKHMKIGHVLGKWYATSGPTRPSQLPLVKPSSFGDLSVSNRTEVMH